MAGPRYRISRVLRVNTQIQELARDPEWRHAKSDLLAALTQILDQLEEDPLTFGEPVFDTKKEGGIVRTGAVRPLSVTYAAFKKDRLVILLDVLPMSPPAKP